MICFSTGIKMSYLWLTSNIRGLCRSNGWTFRDTNSALSSLCFWSVFHLLKTFQRAKAFSLWKRIKHDVNVELNHKNETYLSRKIKVNSYWYSVLISQHLKLACSGLSQIKHHLATIFFNASMKSPFSHLIIQSFASDEWQRAITRRSENKGFDVFGKRTSI